jgi:PTH1 family peptidyl-tRNA hydrolase
VVYDDVDLPLGRMRMRQKGGSGGHRGMDSIIAELQTTAFSRLRLGIGAADEEMVDHVLGVFSEAEAELVDTLLETASDAVLLSLRQGIVKAMDNFNAIDLRADDSDAEEVDKEEQSDSE